ncbi:hypothetical protein PL953_03850 [Bifidobacterium adolescentis]|nr:hypothetical protein [Bifidobacterium adolescentis]MDB1522494.1 hypothetical protein [Bifidobacterium adolescentis]MDB1536264.1 hypothetical protein [Bifidobacterium adolescentis]
MEGVDDESLHLGYGLTDNHRFTQITRTGWPLADISAARIITEWHGR